MKARINIDREPYKNDRPYYILPDNVNSQIRINRIHSFDSINGLSQEGKLKSTGTDSNYFDNSYMVKIKAESIQYLKEEELRGN